MGRTYAYAEQREQTQRTGRVRCYCRFSAHAPSRFAHITPLASNVVEGARGHLTSHGSIRLSIALSPSKEHRIVSG